ncbi:MAG: glycosyltransferase family 2 protein [Chloroflexi bacterium]|nr:glycosyltransferase family 2 protein [Chloroflexota bacterium]
MHDSVGIVVVNWNGLAETRACLGSLLNLDDTGFRIAVVDNGSTDGSVAALSEEFPGVEVIEMLANLGYAAAANAGIGWVRRVGLQHVWLLNNDTLVERDALTALVAAARRIGKPCILAPKILTGANAGRIWSAGGTLRWPWLERSHDGAGSRADAYSEMRQVDWASGCSLFFPLAVVDAAGTLDEGYFLYLEDVDWCWTARQRGIATWYAPDARVWHGVSRSVGSIDPRILRYYACRNYYRLVFRHAGVIGKGWAAGRLAITAVKIAVRLLISPAHRRDPQYAAQTRAVLDVLRRRSGPAPYPHEIAPARVRDLAGASA